MPPSGPHDLRHSPQDPAAPGAGGKVPRTFHCRPELWARFEELAERLACPVDELVADALLRYVRDHVGRTPMPSLTPSGAPPAPLPRPGQGYPAARPSAHPSAHPSPHSPQPSAHPSAHPSPRTPPPKPHSLPPGAPPLPRAPLPEPRPQGLAAPLPPGAPARAATGREAFGIPSPAPQARPPLQVEYQGQRTPVAKDRFVIGRGKKTADLAIPDPNVSRQHALVEFVGGVPFLVDLGSTNGVEFAGQPVARKRIDEGDVFVIGGHVITFTYR